MLVAVLGLFASFSSTASASTVCGDPSQSTMTTTYVVCSNGPIVPQIPGGRFLAAGQEDCPWWFPFNSGRACYTFRAVGAPFIALN